MVLKKDETNIDPQFFLPPNVYDIRYTDKNVQSGEATETTDQSSTEEVITPVDTGTGSILPIPEGLTVVSQTVKAAAGGGYLVDIVVDIPDLPGVDNFDVAVTKA